MKAMVNTQYGPPDVLALTDVEQPIPKDHEVLETGQKTGNVVVKVVRHA